MTLHLQKDIYLKEKKKELTVRNMKFYTGLVALIASSCFVNSIQAMLSDLQVSSSAIGIADHHHHHDRRRRELQQTTNQVSRMQINGWWASCGRLSKKCEGGFKSYGPERIDPTGETCYINPLRRNLGVVQWIAPLGNETSNDNNNNSNDDDLTTYVYTVIFPANLSDTYFPTNCTEAGACSCDSIEPLRAGWQQNPGACGSADAISCPIFAAYLEPGRECNVNEYITYKDPNDGTQPFCSWTISLAATSAAAAAVASMRTLVGTAVLASLSLLWALAM